jgi:hypothetical protein
MGRKMMNNGTYPAKVLGKGYALLDEELSNENNGKAKTKMFLAERRAEC